MQGKAILLRIDCDGAQAEFTCGAHDTDRDLAAISDEYTADMWHAQILRKIAGGITTLIAQPARIIITARASSERPCTPSRRLRRRSAAGDRLASLGDCGKSRRTDPNTQRGRCRAACRGGPRARSAPRARPDR